jgi:hypothetical protein
MRRGLIVLLGLGVIAGYGSAFGHMHHRWHERWAAAHHGECGPWSRYEQNELEPVAVAAPAPAPAPAPVQQPQQLIPQIIIVQPQAVPAAPAPTVVLQQPAIAPQAPAAVIVQQPPLPPPPASLPALGNTAKAPGAE